MQYTSLPRYAVFYSNELTANKVSLCYTVGNINNSIHIKFLDEQTGVHQIRQDMDLTCIRKLTEASLL